MTTDKYNFPRGQWVDDLVKMSLSEDIGSGDATTIITVPENKNIEASVVAREPGVVAGLPLLKVLFDQLDPALKVQTMINDGGLVEAGSVVAVLSGPAGTILTGERIMLNFLQYLSGVATLTATFVAKVQGTQCKVLDTRKTIPGYRHLAKYAVRCGGGHNHRMGLYDRIMLKDNHWATAEGKISELVRRARKEFPDLDIEIEVDTLDQLQKVLDLGVEWIMLDNFSFAHTEIAVSMRSTAHSISQLESSGNVTLESIRSYALAGVDAVSVGRLTHSVPALDLGLDMDC